MSSSNPLLWRKPPLIWSYGIAILSVTVALIIAQWPVLNLRTAPVSLLVWAVLLSAWLGGVGPGLLAAALSAIGFYYYFLPPTHSLAAKPGEIPRLVVFVLSALFVGSLSAAQRRATESLMRARDELKGTVQQLKRTNEALQAESDERKHAEKKLQESEGYLAEAQKLTHTGSWARLSATGEIRYWSEECYRVLGFNPHGGPPQFETFLEHVHPDDQAKVRERAETAEREKVDYELDYRIIHSGGEIREIHVLGHPVVSPCGDLIEFVGTVMDVTERKRAEEERERLRQALEDLAHMNRVNMMGELTASLAHEVNQPIAAAVMDAKTCIRWLTHDQPDLEEAREAASRAMKDAIRAGEIINRIRLLFKKGTPQWELVDINEVIQEMIVLLRNEATRHSISITTELAPDHPQVNGDRVQLQQVLMNLIINAIDAMKDADATRDLVITSQRAKDRDVIVSVSDTGVGLPAHHAEQIFDPFFTTKRQGTGMGLRISRSIIESHGGRLWSADHPPRGASFYFTLPIGLEALE
jgi:PAS domain S-box-containing protein